MINRYMTEKMDKIWNQQEKLKLWLKFQVDTCEALSQLAIIPESDFHKITKNIKLDISLMEKLELETKHDVVAFTRMLSASLGAEKRWIHFGLTSTDMVDSAFNYQIKLSNQIIFEDLEQLKKQLKKMAYAYEKQVVIGRSHGIFAEPTSLGLKFALWYQEINRQIMRLNLAAQQIDIIKITGAMGNFAHVNPKVSEIVAKKWSMKVDECATQVVQRDRYSNLMSVLANIANTIEKIALEIRLSQRSEVNELLEGFSDLQKGSSSMPHKKNPIGSENICGLARLVRSYVNITYENNLLWYERDISHSSNERIIFPDVYHILDFIINRMDQILSHLVVNVSAIEDNIKKANNIYFSQPILLAIIKYNPKISREEAYDFIQKCTLIAQKEHSDFKVVLKNHNISEFLSPQQLEQCYDINNFINAVPDIFNKVFK